MGNEHSGSLIVSDKKNKRGLRPWFLDGFFLSHGDEGRVGSTCLTATVITPRRVRPIERNLRRRVTVKKSTGIHETLRTTLCAHAVRVSFCVMLQRSLRKSKKARGSDTDLARGQFRWEKLLLRFRERNLKVHNQVEIIGFVLTWRMFEFLRRNSARLEKSLIARSFCLFVIKTVGSNLLCTFRVTGKSNMRATSGAAEIGANT